MHIELTYCLKLSNGGSDQEGSALAEKIEKDDKRATLEIAITKDLDLGRGSSQTRCMNDLRRFLLSAVT